MLLLATSLGTIVCFHIMEILATDGLQPLLLLKIALGQSVVGQYGYKDLALVRNMGPSEGLSGSELPVGLAEAWLHTEGHLLSSQSLFLLNYRCVSQEHHRISLQTILHVGVCFQGTQT